jgi:DNA-binding transcriptional LysR family regulator
LRRKRFEWERIVRESRTMVITTDMLGAFVKVAETLSVSAAAAELGVGKGLVSKRVAQLEALVGATLFSRSTRRVSLTPAGELYLEGARRALSEMAAAQERVRDLREQLSGEIRITAPVSWGQRVLAMRLPEFLRLHPGIGIDLQLADRILDVGRERIDLALRWSNAAPPPGLAAAPVAEVQWLLAASPAYLDAAGWPQEPEDLGTHPALCYWRGAGDDQWRLARVDGGARRQVRVAGRYHVNNPEAVADAALAGIGIAMLPAYLCTDALREGRLLRVLPGWTPVTKFGTRITAVGAPERFGLARVQALIRFLRHGLAA